MFERKRIGTREPWFKDLFHLGPLFLERKQIGKDREPWLKAFSLQGILSFLLRLKGFLSFCKGVFKIGKDREPAGG